MFSKKIIYNRKRDKFEDISVPNFIKNIVEIKGIPTETSFKIYPRNTPEILINLADPLRGEIGNQTPVVNNITIQGSKGDYTDVFHPESCHFISIRFAANGYYKLLGKPQKLFTNHFPNLDDVINCDVDKFISQLIREKSRWGRLEMLCAWLKRDVRKEYDDSQLLSDLIITHLEQNPHLSVAQLAEQLGYTRKHLAHQFKEEAGLTIKEYQKINRLQHVLETVSKRETLHWAKIACEHGFYDQSHLIRDFKRYTGGTPTDFLQRQSATQP